MTISGSNTLLASQLSKLQRLRDGLRSLVPALYAAGAVGWVVVLVLQLTRAGTIGDGMLVVVAGVSLLALLMPRWALGISAETATAQRLLDGEQTLADQLQPYLDDEWTLYRNVSLPKRASGLTVLVGPRSIYLLHLAGSADTVQNSREKWLRRDQDGNWQLWQGDPTADAQRLRTQLAAHLGRADCLARVVWCGDGILLTETPTVPVWQLNMMEPIWDELISAEINSKNDNTDDIHERLK